MRVLFRLLGFTRRTPVDNELRCLSELAMTLKEAFRQADKSGLHAEDIGGLACQLAASLLVTMPEYERIILLKRWTSLMAHASKTSPSFLKATKTKRIL